jgi:acyl-coenzyme A thioesterase PaaI-like protein
VNADNEHPVVTRALDAVARTRVRGMHVLGHFVGVDGRPCPVGSARLTLDVSPDERGGRHGVPTLALCSFTDLALMSSIRSHVAAGARLGTVSLSIQHRRVTTGGRVVAEAVSEGVQDGFGTARAVCMMGDEVIAQAQASAVALPPPPGRTPQLLPWELDCLPEIPQLRAADLQDVEKLFVDNVRRAQARADAGGTLVEDELLHFAWAPAADDAAQGELVIGPELGNRVGHLQGGALYAAAARAAGQALGVTGWELVEGSYQFLRPGEGQLLVARSRVLRRGRAFAFVESSLEVGGIQIGAGLYTFRRSSAAA